MDIPPPPGIAKTVNTGKKTKLDTLSYNWKKVFRLMKVPPCPPLPKAIGNYI